MELNFDKEIDALLRQAKSEPSAVADGLTAPLHLNADEISAFAENALPEKAKLRYTAHLADCNSCRKNLSNLILLNAEAESADVHAEEIGTISSATPWYKRLFAFPNLAYTFGALVILFSGIIGFTVLQNVNNSPSSEVSQVNEKPNNTKEMTAAPPETNYANTANMASNANAASVSSSNAMTNVASNTASKNLNAKPKEQKPDVSPNATPQDESRREDDLALSKDKRDMPLDSVSAGSVSEKKQEDKESEKTAETTDAIKAAPSQPKPKELPVNERELRSDAPSAKLRKNSTASTETTNVGGKTFNRRNNVWYDTAYNGQKTTNLTRGTSEYNKLDKDLRVIVENLGGTVVVVWKEKAYRIQ